MTASNRQIWSIILEIHKDVVAPYQTKQKYVSVVCRLSLESWGMNKGPLHHMCMKEGVAL